MKKALIIITLVIVFLMILLFGMTLGVCIPAPYIGRILTIVIVTLCVLILVHTFIYFRVYPNEK